MKVLVLHNDLCNICNEPFSEGEFQRFASIDAPLPKSILTGETIGFHQDCWDKMSNSNEQKLFTYEEWIDLTGDEWDTHGLIEFRSKYFNSDWRYQSECISVKAAEGLIKQKPFS